MYKAMLFYCLNCRKNTESKNLKIVKTKSGRIILLSECAVFDSKNQSLLKSKKLDDLETRTPLTQTPFLISLLF